MKKKILLIVFCAIIVLLPNVISAQLDLQKLGNTAKSIGATDLIGMVKSKLGVNQNQAEGSVGAILKLAKEKLPKNDFTKVIGNITV